MLNYFYDRMPEHQHQKIIIAYREGSTMTELSTKYDVPPNYIHYLLKAYNEPTRHQGTPPNEQLRRERLELFNKGYTVTEIATMQGVSRQAISQVLKKMGVDGWVNRDKYLKEIRELKMI